MKVKQLIAFILAFILCFSNVVYAGGISGGSSAGQEDAGIGDATSSSGNGTWKIPGNTGFRFTIVDASGNPVSHIAGNQNSVSLDVINSGVKINSGEVWTACATDTNQSMNAYEMSHLSMSEFLSYIGESSHNFRWIDSNEALYGDEVREFILKGTKSTSDITDSGGLGTDINVGSGSVSHTQSEPGQQKKTLQGWQTIFESWVLKSKDKSNEESLLNEIKTKRDINLTTDVMVLNGINQWNLLGYFNNCVREVLVNLNYNPDSDDYYNLYFYWDAKTREQFPEAYSLWLQYKEHQKTKENRQTKQASNKDSNNLSLFHLLGGLTAYAAPSAGDSNSGSSSEIGNRAVVDETSVLARIINLQVDGTYVFQLEGSAKTVAEKESGALSPLIVFTEKSYVLLVEATIQGCPQGWNVKLDKAGTSYKSLVYGTAHNWAQFGVSPSFTNSSAYSPSFGNHKRYLGEAIPHAIVTVSDWGGVLGKPRKSGQYKIDDMVALFNTGYGCHLYTTIDLGAAATDEKIDTFPDDWDWGGGDGLHTYDITTNPSVDYYTEPSTGKNESDDYGSKKNKFNVVKYYIYEDELTNEVTEISYYVTTNAPHKVIIDDERNKTGFSLKEYFTSTDDWLPADNHDPSEYKWNEIKSAHKNGKYTGTDYTTVTVAPSDSDNVLHVLYTFTGKEAVNIIKVYKNSSDEIIKTTGPDVAEDNSKYTVQEESDYDYVETLISTSDPDINNPSGESTKSKEIVIEQGTKTLYVIYKEPPKQIKLYSNELSYTYDLRDLVKTRILFEIYDVANSAPGSRPDCGGHSCSDDDCSSSHRCSNDSKTLTDSIWTLSVTDSYDYNNELNFIRDYELSNTKKQGHASYAGGQKASIKPNASFLLIRDKIDDLVTLYPHKNSSLLSELSDLGIVIENYSPSNSRIESEAIKDKDFTKSLSTHFEYASDRDPSLSWRWVRSGRGRHTNTGNYLIEAKTDPSGANKYYSNQNNVKEYYLLGQNNSGTEEAVDMRSDAFSKYSYNKAYSSTSADLKFYPYHLMLYRAKNANSDVQNVYVTSENLSTMKVYNAVQSGVYKKNQINALLDSTQWSTHARSLAFEGNVDKKSVIPGGGILDLSMGNKGDTQLGIRLWQACLRDEQVETVQADGFTTSLSKAKEIALNYQNEVKQVLSGYGLVQWGTEGVQTDLNSVLSGTELHNNVDLNWDGRNYKTSNDSKYYLKHDSTGSDRANFDVLDSKITKQVFYEISSDVNGDIILKKDNDVIASSKLSLNQDISSILSNPEAKLLDDNTKLVTNYFNAIDRGLGDRDKYDRTNSKTYNEAFDGVGVLMTELSFDVGFADNSGHRTTVLDTLLTSTSESKSDLYSFEDDKVRSFVFATTKTSTTATDTSKNGYLGTLAGDSNMGSLSSVLSDIQSFVYTKNFYTSNFNVTDLN